MGLTDQGRDVIFWLRVLLIVGVLGIIVYSISPVIDDVPLRRPETGDLIATDQVTAPATKGASASSTSEMTQTPTSTQMLQPTLIATGTAQAGTSTTTNSAATSTTQYLASRPSGWAIFGIGLIIAGSSLFIGLLLGFLFGIPKTLQSETAVPTSERRYLANTNLEQISDWLTKILVGVGLTQLSNIPTLLVDLSKFLQGGLGNSASGGIFGIAIVLYFLICGFLYGFLWTRQFFAGVLLQADASETFTALQLRDVKAQQLVSLQLDPSMDTPPPKVQDLKNAIKLASPALRSRIGEEARQVRKATWDKNKAKMETTIPIFEALVDVDETEMAKYISRGQLGFAYKDKRSPDYAKAEDMLTEAINLRGNAGDSGYLWYEINRAICRILLDANFKNNQPSTPDQQARIMTDLNAAKLVIAQANPRVKEIDQWLALNKLTL
ncbi:MAG: hypothetical protein KF716_03550 [Anaerolineae bacterium]|nr:hypothetical protein [Anaerolineae bacterium]